MDDDDLSNKLVVGASKNPRGPKGKPDKNNNDDIEILRMPGPQDNELQDRYLEFLTNQFDSMNGKETEHSD